MIRTASVMCLMTIASLLNSPSAKAQFMDLSAIVQQNVAFDQQFTRDVERISWELARMIPDDEPLPFNAMTISKSVNEANKAWDGYNQMYYKWSDRQLQATDRWIDGAIKGLGTYYNPATGQTQQLPWGPNSYQTNPYGPPTAGTGGYGQTLLPFYGN